MTKFKPLRGEESGFTIIELLVVMTTIGILAGLMTSIFSLYRTQAHNAAAKADLRNGLTALQAYLDDNESYPTCATSACVSSLDGFTHSDGVYIAFAQTSGTGGAAVACHTDSGNTAFMKSTIVDLILEIPIGSCGP